MTNSRIIKILVLLMPLLIIFAGCVKAKDTNNKDSISSQESNQAKSSNDEKMQIIESFKNSINNKDTEAFKKIVSPAGLIIIRNFVSGEAGIRGKDIRFYYTVNKIPNDLAFPVIDEIPVKLNELFSKTLQNKRKLTVTEVKKVKYDFKDNGEISSRNPPTDTVISNSRDIIKISENPSDIYELFTLDDSEIVLAEAQLITGILTGNFAVFEKKNGKYFLRAIMDFR